MMPLIFLSAHFADLLMDITTILLNANGTETLLKQFWSYHAFHDNHTRETYCWLR